MEPKAPTQAETIASPASSAPTSTAIATARPRPAVSLAAAAAASPSRSATTTLTRGLHESGHDPVADPHRASVTTASFPNRSKGPQSVS